MKTFTEQYVEELGRVGWDIGGGMSISTSVRVLVALLDKTIQGIENQIVDNDRTSLVASTFSPSVGKQTCSNPGFECIINPTRGNDVWAAYSLRDEACSKSAPYVGMNALLMAIGALSKTSILTAEAVNE